jgi:hypothetical protein
MPPHAVDKAIKMSVNRKHENTVLFVVSRLCLTKFSNFGQHEVRHQSYNSAVERCCDRTAEISSKREKVLYKLLWFLNTVGGRDRTPEIYCTRLPDS